MNISFDPTTNRGDEIAHAMEFGFKRDEVLIHRKDPDAPIVSGFIVTFSDGCLIIEPERGSAVSEWSFIDWDDIDTVHIK